MSVSTVKALDAASPKGRPPVVRGLLLSAVFLASWAGISFIIGFRLPFPNVPTLGPKYRYFDAHKDQIDTVFVGSSRMLYQIIPAEFDAETAASGTPTHSFNLACAGMWPPESFYFLRQILKLRPARLKWVLIDLMNVDSRVSDGIAGAQRAEYWHDGRHTFMAWRDVLGSGRTPAETVVQLWKHSSIFVMRSVNTGRGLEWLETRSTFPERTRKPQWMDRGGFDPLKGSLTGDNLQHFLETVAVLKNDLPRQPVRTVLFDALQQIAAEVRAMGAEPLFVLAPTISARENYAGLPPGVTVLAFNDPAQYPTLFEPDLHFDAWHLNEKGAGPYTRLLARRFVHWRRSGSTGMAADAPEPEAQKR